MTVHKNINCAWRTMPELQDGDTIDGGNWARPVLIDLPQNLIFENGPNMFNYNLTGNNTGRCSNVKKDLCYHKHLDEFLGNVKNLPVEDENCRHDTPTTLIIDGVEKIIHNYQDIDL